MVINTFKYYLFAILVSALFSCGGSSDSDSGGSTSSSLSGTAAIGLALANKTVTVVDKLGITVTTTTDTDGKYTVTVDGAAKPFMLQVDDGNGGFLYSFAEAAGDIANITPMTNLALHEANKNGSTYVALSSLFSSFKDHFTEITSDDLNNAKALVNATVASLLSSNGVANDFDVFKTSFNADNSGIDKVLDQLVVTISGGSVSDITIELNGATAFTFDPTIDYSQFIPGGSSSPTVPSTVSGNIIVMTFDFLSSGQTGPVTLNTDVAFTFSSSGSLFINLDNTGLDEITVPSSLFSESNSEYIWQDQNNDFKYSLSLTSNGDILEINVSKISDGTFVGQFGTLVSNSGSSSSSGSGNASEGVHLTVDSTTKEFGTVINVGFEHNDSIIAVTATSTAGGTIVFRTPNALGAFDCNLAISSDGTYTITSASTCNGNVSSLSPFSATFSGSVFNLNSLQNTELTSGTVNITNMPSNP